MRIRYCINITQGGITFGVLWVPSHNGIKGKERADILAKAAITSPESVNTVQKYYKQKNSMMS